MIAVIKGDIIDSRRLGDADKWLIPLKELLGQWGSAPAQWEILWGDFFQLEISDPAEALEKALAIKALVKRIGPVESQKKNSTIDVRMAIGIGEKTHAGQSISESNGSAFVHSGEKFERLKPERTTLAIRSPWPAFDREMNLYIKLANTFMDSWSLTSGQLVGTLLQHPGATQQEIGEILHIKQNSVSDRWRRAHADELLDLLAMYRSKIRQYTV